MRISDWSSDVCSSDLVAGRRIDLTARNRIARHAAAEIVDTAGDFFFVALAEEVDRRDDQPFAALAIGRASCRERVCQYVLISVAAGSLKKKKKEQAIAQMTIN